VRKINGVGPKADARLATLGITTIAELAAADPAVLQEHFGRSYAEWLHAASHGIDDRPLVTDSETKSISRETTFERDLHVRRDRAILSEIFTTLCMRVAADLQRKGYLARTIGIKLRYEDFRVATRDLTLPGPTADPAMIRRAAGDCLRRVPLERKLRLLGVRAGTLSASSAPRMSVESAQGELPLDVPTMTSPS
jgi:DNA polymerase-4